MSARSWQEAQPRLFENRNDPTCRSAREQPGLLDGQRVGGRKAPNAKPGLCSSGLSLYVFALFLAAHATTMGRAMIVELLFVHEVPL
eukprot:366466-Chlamydomonas_euryale.AAC.20